MNFNFNNGYFRICQLTDVHFSKYETPELYIKNLELMRRCVADLHPDLVVITGDIAWGKGTGEALEDIIQLFIALKTPWAPVLGNHDGNPNDCDIKTREAFAAVFEGRDYCLFDSGRADINGVGNYLITVGDDENVPEWGLVMLDSHEGDVYPSQINWYREISAALPVGHSELSFFHVPLCEYRDVWDFEKCSGFCQESICSMHLNDGLFAAMVRGGAMRGVFVGHDHINDFEGTYMGVRLCYGRYSGYQCYGQEGFRRGARIIDLKAGEKDFETSIYLDTGEIYQQTRIHRPKINR